MDHNQTPVPSADYNSIFEEALTDLDTAFGLPGNYTNRGWWGIDANPEGNLVPSLLETYRTGDEWNMSQKLSFKGRTEILKEIAKTTFSNLEQQDKNGAYEFMMDKLSYHLGMRVCCGGKSLIGNFTGNKDANTKDLAAFRANLIGGTTTRVGQVDLSPGYSSSGLFGL